MVFKPNILLTGGGGYVGCHVAQALRARGIPHLVIDDFSTGHAKALGDTPFIRADLRDAEAMDEIFAKHRPQTVIHLAALATLPDCAARPDAAQRINVDGTQHLLAAMIKHGVRDLVFASSCAVYNATPAGTFLDETITLNPDSVYGKSKLAGEKLLKECGVRSVALRLFNVAGADPGGTIGENHSPETHLLPLAIGAALGTRPPLSIFGNDYPTGDGTAVRDYIHVCDVAEALLRGVEYLKNGGASIALNLGSGVGTSVREMVRAVEKHTGKKVPTLESPRRKGDAPWLVADATLIQSTLGWKPNHSTLDNIIGTALRWHLTQE